jgi:integrase
VRLKLDENLPEDAAETLRALGHDVETVVNERLSGSADERVMSVSSHEGRMLVTLDRGMADIRAYPPGSHAGIVVFRLDDQAASAVVSTVGRMASVLRAVYGYAVDSELVARSPVSGIRLPRVGLVERPTLTADDFDRLAHTLGPEAPMMWLGVLGGLRWAECAGLTVDNLDLLAGTVTVSQQLGRDLRLGPPKSIAGRRRLAIPDWLVEDLAVHLAQRGLTAADAHALVFCAPKGEPLRYQDWLRRTWRPACTEAGLPALRFHDLRSMAATALVAAGVDVRTAQTRMGHSSPSVTLAIYARATAEADRRAADAVGRVLGGVRAPSAHAVNNPPAG